MQQRHYVNHHKACAHHYNAGIWVARVRNSRSIDCSAPYLSLTSDGTLGIIRTHVAMKKIYIRVSQSALCRLSTFRAAGRLLRLCQARMCAHAQCFMHMLSNCVCMSVHAHFTPQTLTFYSPSLPMRMRVRSDKSRALRTETSCQRHTAVAGGTLETNNAANR
eukprot:6210350-Pleurochrysis_carterae.AAC.1